MAGQDHREERSGGGEVVSFRDVHVDDLAVLVDRPVHVPPNTCDFDVGLVNEPAVADTVTARPRGVDEERCEELHPPVDRDVIDVDPTFCEKFFDVTVRQAVAQVPAHSQQDHIWWEPIPGKRNGLINTATAHSHSITSTMTIRQRNGAVKPSPTSRPSTPSRWPSGGHACGWPARCSRGAVAWRLLRTEVAAVDDDGPTFEQPLPVDEGEQVVVLARQLDRRSSVPIQPRHQQCGDGRGSVALDVDQWMRDEVADFADVRTVSDEFGELVGLGSHRPRCPRADEDSGLRETSRQTFEVLVVSGTVVFVHQLYDLPLSR
jgi:hypothetical protein